MKDTPVMQREHLTADDVIKKSIMGGSDHFDAEQ